MPINIDAERNEIMPTARPPDWRIELIRAAREVLQDPDRTARLVALLLAICIAAATLTWSYQVITEGTPTLPHILFTIVNR